MTITPFTQPSSTKTTVDTITAAMVAPASGTRSRMATTTASATEYLLPRPKRTTAAATPAMTLITTLPVT